MRMFEKSAICGSTIALLLVFNGSALAQKTSVKGLITSRDGPKVQIESKEGNAVTVTLDDSTKVQAIKGKLGLRRSDLSFTALVPGLPVEVKAEGPPDQLVAKEVKFKASDLKTANQIQAGVAPTEEKLSSTQQLAQSNKTELQNQKTQIDANQQNIQQTQNQQEALAKRFGDLGDYDVKGTATVYFPVNSSTVDEKAKQDLQQIAMQATQLGSHYMLEVAGYTDSSGNAEYNQQLSDRRAAAVVAYLRQSCGVPLYRVLAPAAMGMSDPAASNETTAGKAQNRRVVVKILVNGAATPTS